MKKVLGLFTLLALGTAVSFGANLTINNVSSVETNCNGGIFNESYYLGKTPTRYFYDNLQGDSSRHYVIGFTSSRGNIYNPYGVFQFEGNTPTFAYKSEIKPRNVSEVIAVHQNYGYGTNIVKHAPNRSDIAAQIVYAISRKEESRGTQKTNTTYKYMKTDKSTDSVSINNEFNSNIITDNECLNTYVAWCGDGILDNGTATVVNDKSTTAGQLAGGEQCDNGALNGTPGNTCSATCTTITTNPVCGNGVIEGSEQCDNGSLNGTAGNSCSTTCTTITIVNTGSLSLTKSLVLSKPYFSGDYIEFKIDFKNNASTVANAVILQDVLPNSLEYVSSQMSITGATIGTKIEQGQFVIEYSGFNLQPGQSGTMTIRTKLKVAYQQCIINPINFVFLYANQNPKPLTAQAGFDCGQIVNPTTPTCNGIIVNKTSNSNTTDVVCSGSGTIVGTPISINCGNGVYNGVANEVGTWNHTCTYGSTSEAQAAKVSCTVGTTSTCNYDAGACSLTSDAIVAIIDDTNDDNNEVRYTCRTKDGTKRLLQIDCGNEDHDKYAETDSSISYTCKYNRTDYNNAGNDKTIKAKCIVDNTPSASCSIDTILDKGIIGICGNGVREGYEQCDGGGNRGEARDGSCLRGCVKPCDEKCDDNVTQCLSIADSNVSIQDDELMPFWWRMYHAEALADENVKCDWDNYNQFKGVLVNRDSMKCDFSLRQPGKDRPENLLINQDCDASLMKNQVIFSEFYPKFWGMAFGSFYAKMSTILNSSNFDNNLFGEYKIRLHQVNYKYCYCENQNDSSCGWKDTEINNVCETDFVVTKPYLIQKSAFGTTPKVSDTKLTNFYDIKGNPLINKTDMSDVMILDGSSYEGGRKAEQLIIDEANKITKLAVAIKNIPQKLKDAGVSVKKVPNKLIYILEGKKGQNVNVNQIAKFTTPFTIITKNINLVIEGSMETNGMFVVQNGNINFQEDTNPAIRCTAPQVVKGIFVTDKDFTTTKLENTNTNIKWCMYGNLQVKGILIGNGIDNLVQNRRSNLNKWFNVSGSETSVKVQRRNQIFNGASLLIEYNPDLWKALPPGADQFVNLLDIYKK